MEPLERTLDPEQLEAARKLGSAHSIAREGTEGARNHSRSLGVVTFVTEPAWLV